MFRLNFYNFSWPVNHRCSRKAGKVVNHVRMTQFCTRNIPRLFGVQFWSFLVCTTENFLDLILNTFLARYTTRASSKQAKLKIRTEWLGFQPEKYPHCLGAFLIDFSHYGWKIYRSNYDDISGPGHYQSRPRAGKFKNRTWMTYFGLEIYRQSVGCNSYNFSSVRLKNISVKFWQLFQARTPLEQVNLKIGRRWLDFALEIYAHCLIYSSYRFPSIRLSNVLVKFWRLFRARKPPEQVKLEIGSEWLDFAPKTYPDRLECSYYCFSSIRVITFSVKFRRLYWHQTPPEQALSRQSWKPSLDDSTFNPKNTLIVWVRFLSFLVSTFENFFDLILTTFLAPYTTEASFE